MSGAKDDAPEPRRRARPNRESQDTRSPERGRTAASERSPKSRAKSSSEGGLSGRRAAVKAAEHVRDLSGKEPEAVTSLESTDQGWRVGIEVLEAQRIPDSTDILAIYLVEVDDEGQLVSYRRERRHYRGRAEESHT
ncbi:gas vesicle protein GvpO [Streptomyces sp. NPDC020681]|uniref:gas vesicle protein GvpO n=1 Tax=Streptomyces sp. NPDC020681 TaxID=3365083 RepID=UPI00378CAE6C